MTSLLSSKTTEDYASEYVLVEEGGENLVLGLGNLLRSTAQKADVVGQTKEPTDVRSKVSFELTESVCVPSQKNVTDVMITITFSWEPDQKVKYIFLEQVKPWHLQAFLNLILQSENISRDTEKLIDDVATALLSKMIVDQEPRRINTKSINMELSRMSSRSRGTSADFTDDDKAGFKFPLAAIIDDKPTTPKYIDSVVSLHWFPWM